MPSGSAALQRKTRHLTKRRAEQLASTSLYAALDRETEERATRPIRGPPSKAPGMQPVILRRRAVEAMTGLSCSTIYALMAEGKFPSPIRLGPKAVGWLRSDLEAWIESRPLARRARLIRQERQASEAP